MLNEQVALVSTSPERDDAILVSDPFAGKVLAQLGKAGWEQCRHPRLHAPNFAASSLQS